MVYRARPLLDRRSTFLYATSYEPRVLDRVRPRLASGECIRRGEAASERLRW